MKRIFSWFMLSFLLFAGKSNAQCTGGTLDANLVPSTVWQTVTSHSHKYFTFNAIAGNVYTFSYCSCNGGSMTYSGELSIDSTATTLVHGDNSSYVASNTAFCDDAFNSPQVTWKCFTSGTYRVLTNVAPCAATTGKTATLAYKMETPSLCYTVASTTYAPDAFNAGTKPPGMKVDDGISKAISIGFSFCYNGIYYDSLFISSNCYITFIGSCPTVPEDTINRFPASSYTTQSLPFTNTTYTSFIAPGVCFPWIDAYPLGGGNIFYKLYGVAPNRHFTVSFNNVDLYQCNAKKVTTEVQLFETTNNIQIQAKAIAQCAGWKEGGQGVMGLLDETGYAALVPPGRNHTPGWTVTTPEAWLFTPSCCTVLPINIGGFTCQDQGSGILLKWSTYTETNNKYFTVERSVDGYYFEPVAQIPGAGNSSQTLNYSYLDTTVANGTSYYRLRQTDFDGGSIVSATTVCSVDKRVAGTIYPNPSTGSFNVLIGPSAQPQVLTIYDMIGRAVFTQQVPPDASFNSISVNVPQLKGVYILQITGGQQTVVNKLLLK